MCRVHKTLSHVLSAADSAVDCSSSPLLRLQYHLAYQRYEFCCQELIAYIDAHFSPSSTSQVALSSGESNGRYLQLMEMLLFHVLVPLRAYDEAIEFLRKGKKHRPGHSAEKDQRISPEMKEVSHGGAAGLACAVDALRSC